MIVHIAVKFSHFRFVYVTNKRTNVNEVQFRQDLTLGHVENGSHESHIVISISIIIDKEAHGS